MQKTSRIVSTVNLSSWNAPLQDLHLQTSRTAVIDGKEKRNMAGLVRQSGIGFAGCDISHTSQEYSKWKYTGSCRIHYCTRLVRMTLWFAEWCLQHWDVGNLQGNSSRNQGCSWYNYRTTNERPIFQRRIHPARVSYFLYLGRRSRRFIKPTLQP